MTNLQNFNCNNASHCFSGHLPRRNIVDENQLPLHGWLALWIQSPWRILFLLYRWYKCPGHQLQQCWNTCTAGCKGQLKLASARQGVSSLTVQFSHRLSLLGCCRRVEVHMKSSLQSMWPDCNGFVWTIQQHLCAFPEKLTSMTLDRLSTWVSVLTFFLSLKSNIPTDSAFIKICLLGPPDVSCWLFNLLRFLNFFSWDSF